MMNIYVGNLPFSMTEADLEELFRQHGEVRRASIIMDRETGRSRGFGFVELTDAAAGQNAINALNGFEIQGRKLAVNEAKPREAGSGRGFGGGGRGGFAGGAGGGGSGGGGGGGRRGSGGW